MRILGVTGKIGVGKSTVCAIMARLGAKVIDADKVVSALYEQGCAGATKIRHFFGEDFLLKNGRVNKRKLRATVFHDEKKLSILEKMIHPLVTHEIQKEIDQQRRQRTGIFVIEAMEFAPNGLGRLIDELVLVTCPGSVLKKRLKGRTLFSDEFLVIKRHQKEPAEYDWRIENDGNLKELEEKVLSLRTSCGDIFSRTLKSTFLY